MRETLRVETSAQWRARVQREHNTPPCQFCGSKNRIIKDWRKCGCAGPICGSCRLDRITAHLKLED